MDDQVLVELVDGAGRTVGSAPKSEAHVAPGRLHRAVSVLLLDGAGRLLIQRRAATKYHSGGRWSNTVCGHPVPGEEPEAAAVRRLKEELTITLEPGGLHPAGVVVYDLVDPGSTLVEREYDHLFVGSTASTPKPDPHEVDGLDAVVLDAPRPPELEVDGFTSWYSIVVAAAMPDLIRLRARQAAGNERR